MLKIIKKTARFLLVGITAALLPLLIFMLLLSLAPVQTFIAKNAVRNISDRIKSTISVGGMSFDFFNRISATDILIMDIHNDTMLYVPRLTASVRGFDVRTGAVRLGRAIASDPVVALIKDSTGLLNLRWYLDHLPERNDKNARSGFSVSISAGEIRNGTFRLVNMVRPAGKGGIDFKNLNVNSVDAHFSDFLSSGDSVKLKINRLSALEQSGFGLRDLSAHFSVSGSRISFESVSFISDYSYIEAPFVGLEGSTDTSFQDFANEVRFDIRVNRSSIHGRELAYFIDAAVLPNNLLNFTGELKGPLSELRGRNMTLKSLDETVCEFNFNVSGLPELKNAFIFFEINRLRTSAADIQKIVLSDGTTISIPDKMDKPGPVTFAGTFTGFINDFVTYGRLHTPFGSLTGDLSLRPEGSGSLKVKGNVKGINLDLGELSGYDNLLGASSFSADIDGRTEAFRTFAINLTGRVDSLEVNQYNYRNLNLTGYFTEKTWDGSMKIEDKNVNLDLLGMFDFSKELPEFDFTLNLKRADLFRLNIDKKDSTSAASMLLTANFTGSNIDNLDGEIRLLNSSFRKFGQELEVYDFQIITSSTRNIQKLTINTDFFNTEIEGRYNFATLGSEIKTALAVLFPARYPSDEPGSRIKPSNDFAFTINIKKGDELNQFLRTGFRIADNCVIKGIVNPDSIVSVNGKTEYFGFRNNMMNNLSFSATFIDSAFKAVANSSSLSILSLSELENFKMDFVSEKDRFKTGIRWDDGSSQRNSGIINAEGEFLAPDYNSNGRKTAPLKLAILPGEVYVRNNLWNINQSEIFADSSSIKITNFAINNENNFFSVEGRASEDKNDTIYLRMEGVNISALNNLYDSRTSGDPDKIYLAIGGKMGGTVSLTDVYRNFMFETDIRIEDFAILESNYGEVKISALWNNINRNAQIEINNSYEGKRMFDVTGYYDPEAKFIDLTARADKLPIEIMNPLLKMFASDIGGTASGTVRFFGLPGKPYLTGALYAENSSIRIDYLQTRYTFSDSIRFDKEGIRFRNIVFRDERGNTGNINGSVLHKNFKEFDVDLTIRPENSMVLNTRPKDNELFYGTAFAGGIATIRTNGQVLRFDISARTGRNTRFFIPLNTGMSVSESSFITFINPAKEDTGINPPAKSAPVSTPRTSVELVFDLEVTPDAEVQLLMDPKAGDIMKGSGTGNLNISLDRRGAFRIFGGYTIETGDYLFTLGNIINKSFTVESGGRITFNGDVDNADIDIRAVYKTKASLHDIMPGMSPDSRLMERIPVECLLILTGKLFNPVVGFDIVLPTADEEARAYLRNMIKSEEEMSRQFLFLLVMNSFYADPSVGSPHRSADIGSATVGVTTATVGVTTMEMLSNQLSNWLSQISNDFDIGINYRPGSSALPNSQELQVALSTQLLNDRVTINGNFDVAGNQATGNLNTSSTNSFTGAFNIEYKISERLRFRFFNRSNDNIYIEKGIQYTQGIGLFFRQDFNRLRDIFTRREKQPALKEEEVRVVNN